MDLIFAVVCLGLLTIALLFLGQRFKIPSIVCFLIIGILAGPYALSIVTDQSTIETIGQIGVILLLFAIGLEFSFKTLIESWRVVVIGGTLQVVTTIAVASGVMCLMRGLQIPEAIFFGFLVSLSSTAIVMKVLQERGDVETISGRTLLGILIFQDLAVIPMMLLTPMMMGTGGISYSSIPLELAKVVCIFAVLIVSARWVVPWFLYRVAKQRSRELFVFTVAAVCFVVAWLTNAAGLSYALGAFVAGLIIGESEFSIDAVSTIIPFRDVFAAIFFISIGMLLDPTVIFSRTEMVVTILAIILIVKTLTGSFTAAFLGMPARVAVFVGLALAQIGEFSFVLAKSALGSNLIGEGPYQVFLFSAILTMALTPFLMNASDPIAGILYRLFPSRIGQPVPDGEPGNGKNGTDADHIIIVGFGMTGKSVARAAEIAGIPYNVIDLDPDVIRKEREKNGHARIFFGDATHREILEHAGIRSARALVIVISEQNVVPRIIRMARELNPSVFIVVRTRHVREAQNLLTVGADEVIPEEFESSLRIFSTILAKYTLPDGDIDGLTRKIRSTGYMMFSKATTTLPVLDDDFRQAFGGDRIHSLCLPAGSAAAGTTIGRMALRKQYSLGLIAIRRGESTITSPPAETVVQEGDVLILFGSDSNVQKFSANFSLIPGTLTNG